MAEGTRIPKPPLVDDPASGPDDRASRSQLPSWADGAQVLRFAARGPHRVGSPPGRQELGSEDAERLMERVRAGDIDAFERIVEAYWAGTLIYALQLVGEQDVADDLAQEAFARLWQTRLEWRGDGCVRAWLLRTVRRLFLSDRRKASVRAQWAMYADEKPSRRTPTPLQELERNELRAAVREAVRSLPPRRREAFTLVHLHGLTNLEAAEIMDVRPQTIANYLQAAFADLRELLRPHFPSFRAASPGDETDLPPSGGLSSRLALDG